MAKKIDSKKMMLDHSEAKVRLLGKYLDRYLNIIANDGFTNRILIFDLFCGEGLYENGGKGSPLIILDNVRNLHFINKAKINKIPKIDIVLNDINSNKIKKVSDIVNEKKLHFKESGNLKFTNYDYQVIIPKLTSFVNRLKSEKAFIFIDPYGYKEIRASHIKGLLTSKKTEVLLFLPTQFMYRFDSAGTPESLIALLDDLVDYENWKNNDSVMQFIQQFKEGFKKHLGQEYFVDTFTIQKDKNTCFCLFFFSSHIRGFEKMLEAKWDIDNEEGKGWKYEKTGNLFSSQKINPLENELLKYLAKTSKTNKEIYNFTLHQGFLPKHITEILIQWQNEDKVEVLLESGIRARKGAFYINYSSFKEVNAKAIIKLK